MPATAIFAGIVCLLQWGAAGDCLRRKDWIMAAQWFGVGLANGALALIAWQRVNA